MSPRGRSSVSSLMQEWIWHLHVATDASRRPWPVLRQQERYASLAQRRGRDGASAQA